MGLKIVQNSNFWGFLVRPSVNVAASDCNVTTLDCNVATLLYAQQLVLFANLSGP